MNESERIEHQQHQPLHHEPFENFDYYTDYSETPDSITSSSQYTNNDCMMNNGDTDNNNNINHGATNNEQKNNCKENNNQQATNESDWQQTITTAATTPSSSSSLASPSATSDTIRTEAQTNGIGSNSESSIPIDGNQIKKNDLPSVNTTIKSPAKHNTNKKVVKSKKVSKYFPVFFSQLFNQRNVQLQLTQCFSKCNFIFVI